MARILLPLTSALMVVAATLTLQSCKSAPQQAEQATGPTDDLIVLADGATMAARKGSVTRAMADWFADGGREQSHFEMGGELFRQGSAELTPKGLGRAVSLATLIRGTADAKVEITARAATPELAERRAATLTTFLRGRGIVPNQIVDSGRNGEEADAQEREDSQIRLSLRRVPPTPIETAAS